jgi:DNA polymerase bacteriophage-type
MKNTLVDFETFYDTKNDISTAIQGLENYVRTQEAYIVSIVDDEFEFCGTIEQAQKAFPAAFWEDPERQFWAANSNFDFEWKQKYWPTKCARDWNCILDRGVGNQLPRDLANLCRVALGVKIDKSIRDDMNGVRFEELPEDRQQATINYCLNDSIQSMALLKTLPALSPVENEIAALTRLQNRRGVHIDVERVDKDMTMLHKIRHSALLHIPWRADCGPEGKGMLSARKLAKWCDKMGIPVPASLDKRSEDCTDLMTDHPALGEVINWMRKYRTAGTLLAKGETLRLRLTPDNRLPLDLLYCGAPHTRRWSSQGWNIQNLAKEPFFGEIVYADALTPKEHIQKFRWGGVDYLVDMHKSEWVYLRNWIIPAPGKKFLIFDFSQIEPRCLNWLAGNDELLTMIAAGYGVYEAYAATFKGWRGQPGTLKKSDPRFYAACKAEVLGLGYGMGAAKYIGEAAKEGIELTLEQSQQIVQAFRSNNPKIPALWNRLDEQMKQAILTPDKHLRIQMPTGDYLHHFHIRQTAKVTEDGRTRASFMSSKMRGVFDERGVVRNLWGGTLTENVTQRMGRDIFAEAQLRAEKNDFLSRFSAHDEGVFEVDDGSEKFLADQKAELERILTITPDWAEGVPLAVEGSYEDRYTK